MSRCSKSIAANLSYNPSLDLGGNIRQMLNALQGMGITEVQVSHLSKQFPEGYSFSGWDDSFAILTEKVEDARGWYVIKTGESMPESVESTVAESESESSVELEIVTNSTGVVWTPTQTAEDNPIYAEDAGLKRIALMDTKCFGEFVNKGKCKSCPLAGSCQVASFSKIASFAAALDAETEKGLLPPEPVVEEPVVEAPEIQETSAPETPAIKEGWKVWKSPITSVCSGCEEKIFAGSDCINIRGKGNFHMGCAE